MKPQIKRLSDKTMDSIAASLFRPVAYGESAAGMVYPESDIDWRVNQLLEDKQRLRQYLGKYYQKYIFVLIYADKDSEQILIDKLKSKLTSHKIKYTPTDSLSALINAAIQGGYEVFFFVDNAQHLLTKDHKFFSTLLTHSEAKARFNAYFFFEADITQSPYRELLPARIVQNLTIFPLYGKEDAEYFIRYIQELWNLSISPEEQQRIISMCGGHLWILKEALRFRRDNPEKPIDEAWNQLSMQMKLEKILQKFTKDELQVLTQVVSSGKASYQNNKHILAYFERLQLIIKKEGIYLLQIPILSQSLLTQIERDGLQLDDEGMILFKGEHIAHILSPKELALLRALLSHRGIVVSREDLAKAIWEDTWEEKFSDWALDKLVLRVRKRLSILGLPDIIQTKKRVGFTIPN